MAEKTLDALDEIARAFEAWDNDEPFGLDTDKEREFECDADFVEYMGALALGALPAKGGT